MVGLLWLPLLWWEWYGCYVMVGTVSYVTTPKNTKLDVDPQRNDDASPMSTYRWDLLECWFQLFSASQIQFRTFFGSYVVVLEDLSVDVSITNEGLILTKPGRFFFLAYGNLRTEFNFVDFQLFEKKFTVLGFHGEVLVKTIPLMYQLLM